MHQDVPTLVQYCVRAVGRRLRHRVEPDRKPLILLTKALTSFATAEP